MPLNGRIQCPQRGCTEELCKQLGSLSSKYARSAVSNAIRVCSSMKCWDRHAPVAAAPSAATPASNTSSPVVTGPGAAGSNTVSTCDMVFVPRRYHLHDEAQRRRYLEHNNDPLDADYRQLPLPPTGAAAPPPAAGYLGTRLRGGSGAGTGRHVARGGVRRPPVRSVLPPRQLRSWTRATTSSPAARRPSTLPTLGRSSRRWTVCSGHPDGLE